MKITYLVLGPFMTNTYIIYDENTMDAVIIDPSFTPENIIRAVAQLKVNVKGIFLTHGLVIFKDYLIPYYRSQIQQK